MYEVFEHTADVGLRVMAASLEEPCVDAARGERYDPARHTLAHEIKAIMQHELDVRHSPAGSQATLIMDI